MTSSRQWTLDDLDDAHPLPDEWEWIENGKSPTGAQLFAAAVLDHDYGEPEVDSIVYIDDDGNLRIDNDAAPPDVCLAVLLVSRGQPSLDTMERVRDAAVTERDELLRAAANIGVEGLVDPDGLLLGSAGAITRSAASLMVAALRIHRPPVSTGIVCDVDVDGRNLEVIAQWSDAPARVNAVDFAASVFKAVTNLAEQTGVAREETEQPMAWLERALARVMAERDAARAEVLGCPAMSTPDAETIPALAGYGPTGINMMTGQPVWRTFTSRQQWINKAASWMHPGDVCIDANGVVLRRGADFDGAAYPVVIARPLEQPEPDGFAVMDPRAAHDVDAATVFEVFDELDEAKLEAPNYGDGCCVAELRDGHPPVVVWVHTRKADSP